MKQRNTKVLLCDIINTREESEVLYDIATVI